MNSAYLITVLVFTLLLIPITTFADDYLWDYSVTFQNETVIEKESYNLITVDVFYKMRYPEDKSTIIYPDIISIVNYENKMRYFADKKECNIPTELEITWKGSSFTACFIVPKEAKRFDLYVGTGLSGPLNLHFQPTSSAPSLEEIMKDLPVTDSMQIILNQQNFSENDSIKLSGHIPEIQLGTIVSIEVISPDNNLAYIDQMGIQGKLFSFEIPTGGNVKKAGTYTVRATYGSNSDEVSFYFQGTNKTIDSQTMTTITETDEESTVSKILLVAIIVAIIGIIVGVIVIKHKKEKITL